ncbi:MAG: hypothetical protein J6W28_05760, partial [Clostridia bacterium]|nr:hypothetical protein [Clostridia bacterium]
IHRFSSLGGVLSAPSERLCEIPGIGPRTAAYLRGLLPFVQHVLEEETEEAPLTVEDKLKGFFIDYFAKHEDAKTTVAYLNNRCEVLEASRHPAERFSEGSISARHFLSSAYAYGAATVALAHRVRSAIPFPDMEAFGLVHSLETELVGSGVSLYDAYLISGEKSVSVKATIRGVSHVGKERPRRAASGEDKRKGYFLEMLSLFMSRERAEETVNALSDKPLTFFFFTPYKKLVEEYPEWGTVLYFIHVAGELLSYVRRERLRLSPPLLRNASEVGSMFRSVLCGRRGEVFCLASLDKNGRLIRVCYFAEGTVTVASVPARAILEEVTECNAYAVALAHNHPCGTIQVSKQDENVTREIMAAMRSLGVRFLDHFVVNEKEHCAIARNVLHMPTDATDDFYV